MTLPRLWPEHEMIEREYPKRGRHWIAQKLGRSPDVIHNYARRHGLELGDLPNHVRLSELAAATNQTISSVYNRANAEGVITRYRAATEHRGTFAAVVPTWWADAYVEEITNRQHGDTLQANDGWLTTNELVKLWRVGKGTVLRGLNGKGVLAPLLEDARTARGMAGASGGSWLLHPDDAQRVTERLNADRAKARGMISTKVISVECSVPQSHAADVGKEMGGELLFVHGRLMRHVTPKAAKAMRRRFRQNKGLEPRPFKPRVITPPKACTWCGEVFHRRHEPYEAPGLFKLRTTCSPRCRGFLAGATRRANNERSAAP